jgi:hypothetical protein
MQDPLSMSATATLATAAPTNAPPTIASTAGGAATMQQRQQQATLQFLRLFARTLTEGSQDAPERAERLCESAPGLCEVAWPFLAAVFPEAADLFVGSAEPGAPARALTPYDAIAWARWRQARSLFDAGQFDRLEEYCMSSPGRSQLCDIEGLEWAQDYAANFDPAAEAFFGPGGLDDTLAKLLLWRRQQADRRRRALYGLGVAYDEWLAEAEDRGAVTDSDVQQSAVTMAGASENDLQLRLRGLLGTSRATDIVPLGASLPPPARVSPIPVMIAPIDRWTAATIANGQALARVPDGATGLIAMVRDRIINAEIEGLEIAVGAARARRRRVRANAAVGAATAQEVDQADQLVRERVAERDNAIASRELSDTAHIGTAFPGTGVYLMQVFVGDALVPTLGVIPSASRALPPPDCPQCIVRMSQGLPPIIGAHPRHG